MSTFRVLMHENEHAVDIVNLMGDIDACRRCINENSLEYIERTEQPFTMSFRKDNMDVRIITNENNAFIVEKSGKQFEPDRANESTEHFFQRVLTIDEMILVDNILFSGQVLTDALYDAWMKACQGIHVFERIEHVLKMWDLLRKPGELYKEILLPLRSGSKNEHIVQLFEPFAHRLGLDVVTFDVKTL